jgi:intracellular multiplication protein IcmX
MNRFSKFALINLFYLTTLPALADDSTLYSTQQTASNTQNLVKYLLNLGSYLGYNIAQAPNSNNISFRVSQTLFNLSATQLIQMYMFNSFLGAVPVNAFSTALAQIVPEGVSGASAINAWANNVFNTQNFNNPQSQQQGKVAVNPAIDQQNYQQDPISQGILNILGTPDISYCMNYDGDAWVGCSQVGGSTTGTSILPASGVTANIIGQLPSTYQYYSYQYNQQFLSQLNSNSLTGPLLYGTQGSQENTNNTNNQNIGLTAQNQAQQAANFIRYVSGGVTPARLPNLKVYDTLYTQATASSDTATPTLQQIQAQATLTNYFTTLRTYAAQFSVGISNLYFIMSKRLPQNQGSTDQSKPSSQALSEFKMATWRLFNPDMSTNNQWINQINNASAATVGKEIATLLAEINYQLYLDRQIQERILLTNTTMLMQNTRAAQPFPTFTNTPSGANTTPPTQ